jgi:hypothetical protein
MSQIARRVARLEDAVKDEPPPPVVQIIVQPEEAEDDVIARYRLAHPEAPEDIFWIVHKIVRPQQCEVGS